MPLYPRQSADGNIVALIPSAVQLETLQRLCQSGEPLNSIASRLGVPVQLLLIWGAAHEEAGDALSVARAIADTRHSMRI